VIGPVRDRSTFRALRQAPSGRCGVVRARYLHAPTLGPSVPVRLCSPPAAVAYALSRRTGTAVTRNRIRRRLRAAVRELDRRGVLHGGAAYLLSSGPEAAHCRYPELLGWVEGAVRRASTVRGASPEHNAAPVGDAPTVDRDATGGAVVSRKPPRPDAPTVSPPSTPGRR
jgi:ribonuclease P protein component